MTNIKFDRKDFESHLGKTISKQIESKISLFGTPLESLSETEVEVEIFPNRPDLLSLQGYLRAFKAFLGDKSSLGLKKYSLKKPEKNYKVKIDKSVKSVRPYTACAIVKNLSFSDKKIKEIIDLQEKIHATIGRNRKKVAVGIYPLDKIELPITYKALPPDKIRFIPLEYNKELSANQILSKHPTGRAYAHLLENHSAYPVFLDAKNNVLSMPPIINSHETGKISESTKSVFIECSGSDLSILQKTLNIVVTTLADMGGKIYGMNLEYPYSSSGKKETIKTPDLSPQKMKVSLKDINSVLGLELKESDLSKLIPKMGMEYKSSTVTIPSWRTDIIHPVDIAEDVAIAYGYDNLIPEIPNVSTTGSESAESKIKSKISEILIGLKFIETSTYHLIKEKEAKLFGLTDTEKIETLDSKTEYKILRPNLLIPALRILSENKDSDYPQNIFEIGTVFSLDQNTDKSKKTETGISEQQNLIISCAPSNFTELKQVLDYLSSSLNIELKISEAHHKALIQGRSASIILNNKHIGYIGEVHPSVLSDFNIKMPLSVLEIDLNEIFKVLI